MQLKGAPLKLRGRAAVSRGTPTFVLGVVNHSVRVVSVRSSTAELKFHRALTCLTACFSDDATTMYFVNAIPIHAEQ